MVEADLKGFFDPRDQDGRLTMLAWRSDDRAFRGLLRTWLQAGILETDGRVLHPDTGVPHGGVVSPGGATVDVHDALDRWFEQVVNPPGRGEAVLSRSADDRVCAVRFRSAAAWFYQALPQRLGQFTREGASEQPRSLRFSRVQPGLTRRFTWFGVECYWQEDRQGGPRVKRRTARTKWPRAGHRIKAWMQANRHVPGKAFFDGLKARWRGPYRDDGVQGNAHALARFVDGARAWAFTGRNRRGGQRRSVRGQRFTQRLDAVPSERPRLPESRRRRVDA